MTSLDIKFSVPSPTNNPATSFAVGVIYCVPSQAWIIQILTSNTSPWSHNMSRALMKIATYGLTESNISYNPCTVSALILLSALIIMWPNISSAFSQFDNSLLVSCMYNWANFRSNPDGESNVPVLWWLLPLIRNTYGILIIHSIINPPPPNRSKWEHRVVDSNLVKKLLTWQ